MTSLSKGIIMSINVLVTGAQIIFLRACTDSSNALLVTGTTTLYVEEIQSDGSLKTLDFNGTPAFKSGACTTPTVNMTAQKANNNTVDTGIWTYAFAPGTAFTVGKTYAVWSFNTSASPIHDWRTFQYGGQDGDPIATKL